jgi:hypothetical protein
VVPGINPSTCACLASALPLSYIAKSFKVPLLTQSCAMLFAQNHSETLLIFLPMLSIDYAEISFPYTDSLNLVISKELKQSSMDQLQVQWSHCRNTIHLLIKCTLSTPLPPASIQISVCGNSQFA